MRLFGKIIKHGRYFEGGRVFLALFAEYTVRTVTHGKWQGDHYIQGGRYIQVNFAEKYKATVKF